MDIGRISIILGLETEKFITALAVASVSEFKAISDLWFLQRGPHNTCICSRLCHKRNSQLREPELFRMDSKHVSPLLWREKHQL